jgi:hypothetical protein
MLYDGAVLKTPDPRDFDPLHKAPPLSLTTSPRFFPL